MSCEAVRFSVAIQGAKKDPAGRVFFEPVQSLALRGKRPDQDGAARRKAQTDLAAQLQWRDAARPQTAQNRFFEIGRAHV